MAELRIRFRRPAQGSDTDAWLARRVRVGRAALAPSSGDSDALVVRIPVPASSPRATTEERLAGMLIDGGTPLG